MTDEVIGAPAAPQAEPSAPAAPVASVESTPTAPDAQSATPADPAAQAPKKVDGRLRRINELTYQLREAERRAERHEKLLEEAIKRTGNASAQPTTRPKLENFKTFEEYEDARESWRQSQQAQPKGKQDEPSSSNPQAQAFEQERNALMEEGEEKYEDFADVVTNPDLKISGVMGQYVLESGRRIEMAYFLGQNPKESARIARLTPTGQVAELVRLEDKIASKAAAIKRPSAAPAPVTPVGGAATSDAKPSTSDDIGTWMKKRNAQLRGKGK